MSDQNTSETEVINDTEVLYDTEIFSTEASDVPPALAVGPAPRIRWGSIMWGIITCAIAVTTLGVATSDERRESFLSWTSTLSTPDVVALGTVGLGVVILLIGVSALTRRSSRER